MTSPTDTDTDAGTEPDPPPTDKELVEAVKILEAVDVADAGAHDAQYFSVTTILKALSSPGLEYWAIQQAANAAIDSPATWQAMLQESGREEAAKWLIGARYRKPKLTLSAADLGTAVHKVCETYALTGEKPNREFVTELVAMYAGPMVDMDEEVHIVGKMLQQFDIWLQRFQPVYIAAEMAVYSPTYGYAGQLDAILSIDGMRFCVDYKGLDVTTPLATPDGWTTMGAVQVGDQVFGTTGQPVKVTAKSEVHMNNCYRITFDDTTSIVCDDEHLWQVTSKYTGWPTKGPYVERTDKLRDDVVNPVTGQRHLFIPMPDALNLPPCDLPIDPYVYGCWLGDGYVNGGDITKPDEELFDLIRARGYHVGEPMGNDTSRCRSRTVFGLARQLRTAGLLGHRVIPGQYLRSNVNQRLDLLCGLMDTDGSWNSTRNQAVFSTVDKATAENVYELIITLGERPLINTSLAHGFGKEVTVYQVTWRPRLYNPFALPRKADAVKVSDGNSWRRLIMSIEPTLTVPTQCITVDAADDCYLAGTQMVPTHNTRREPLTSQGKPQRPYGETALQLAAYRYADMAAIWRPRRVEKFKRRFYLLSPEEQELAVPVPQVDGGLCILLTPNSCESYPLRCDEDVFASFLYAFEIFRWEDQTSKTVVGDPLIARDE